MTLVRTAWSALVGLVVDDGLLAVMTLGAVVVISVLTRDFLLGPVDASGWILVALLFAALIMSVRRTVVATRRAAPSLPSEDPGDDQVANTKRDHDSQ